MNPWRQHSGRSRGQALVEFALVLPLFLLLILSAVDFGRAYLRLHMLTNAAREGARVGSLPDTEESDVEDAVNDFLTDAGLDSVEWPPSEITVTDPDGDERGGLADAEPGDRVKVLLVQEFAIIGVGFVPGTDGTIDLSATCTFRQE
ncbi:MAG: TadE/TadG family type IV pilus assembly protein [Planctomycetota bacterium]